jgi:hypothetical protein
MGLGKRAGRWRASAGALVVVLLAGHGIASAQDEPEQELQPAGLTAALFDELEEIYPDSDVASGRPEITLHSARGVPVAVHVLVSGAEAGGELGFGVTAGGKPVPQARWCRMIDVPVEENTGLVSRTERYDGKRNPHVIRRAPFRVFEALQPVRSPVSADAAVVALRLEIPVPISAAPGLTDYVVSLSQDDQEVSLELEVHVHRAVVPRAGRDTLHYTNWFSTGNIAGRHGLEPWSEEFWSMLGRYASLLARGRQNTFWLRWSDVFEKDPAGVPKLDRARLERYVETFRNAGLWWIEGAPIARRPGGDWSSTTLELGIVKVPATGPEGRAALAGMCGQLLEALEANGWRESWLQHLADEPTDTNADDYNELAAVVKALLPGVPIVEATMSRRLEGSVDVWCPQVQKYQQHQDFFGKRRAQGDRIWVYTCLAPGGPWLNRLLDQERLRQVHIGWAAASCDLHGFLHWGLNHYKADPFTRSVVDHPAQPNTNNRLPAGDSHIIYPGPDCPWSSHRFESHRIGLEDHELLKQLQAGNPQAARTIIGSVFRAFDDYTTSVADYRRAKRLLLEALDTAPAPEGPLRSPPGPPSPGEA